MKTSKHLDWLSITIPNSANWRNFIPFADLILTGKGRHGYGQSWRDKRTGAIIETASTRDDMGTHLTLSGDVLQTMRDDLGAVDDAIIQRIGQWDGKCSRVDLAIDVFGASFTPGILNQDLLSCSAKIHARTWRFIDGHQNGINGATVDTGSSASDRRFRFYDKRAEQRIKDGEAWVRLELQLRRLYAKSVVATCGQYGTSEVITATIGNYLTWENTEYHAALTGGSAPIAGIPRKDSNRKKWLLGQVASALADEILIDAAFLDRFMELVRTQLEVKRQRLDEQNR